MKLKYFPDTDTFYIDLKPIPAAETHEIADDVVVDFDGEGNVVGIEIDHASKKLDFGEFEIQIIS